MTARGKKWTDPSVRKAIALWSALPRPPEGGVWLVEPAGQEGQYVVALSRSRRRTVIAPRDISGTKQIPCLVDPPRIHEGVEQVCLVTTRPGHLHSAMRLLGDIARAWLVMRS